MSKTKAFSPTNIALAKYWGKRNIELNLPTNSSLSVSFANYGTETEVEIDNNLREDILFINNVLIRSPASLKKVENVLTQIRTFTKNKAFAKIQSYNNFPTGAGLASSASGLSALTIAAAKAYQVDLTLQKLSTIARMGSGSACRSLFDGFVFWNKGNNDDGTDSFSESIATQQHWNLDATICIVNDAEKHMTSTDGMTLTQNTSLLFKSWTEYAEQSAARIKSYILSKNFEALAAEVELNCMRMHASAMSANPSIIYFRAQTLNIIERVLYLRSKGYSLFYTIDAGPNVIIFSENKDTNIVRERFSDFKLLFSFVSKGAHIL